jgi:phosphoribosylaminoimidazole-succinocarboxamide synthase
MLQQDTATLASKWPIPILNKLDELGFEIEFDNADQVKINGKLIGPDLLQKLEAQFELDDSENGILNLIPIDFANLPLVTEGESKEIRQWTTNLVVARFKPTVYSFTENRYGNAAGTDLVRARFSAKIFSLLNKSSIGIPKTSFVALLETEGGPLVVQKVVDSSNLEVRVKRFHIGSPLHRYRYTEDYPSLLASGPVTKWTRFDKPVVCFDWRNPLYDNEGNRLADEPISDDYAELWMQAVPDAKRIARDTFLYIEGLFKSAGLSLIDICFLIDKTGKILYGEISPDCMRVREIDQELEAAQAYDKDLWRNGKSENFLTDHYQQLYDRVFGVL